MKHCVFTQLQEEKKKREEEVQRKNQELQEKTDQVHHFHLIMNVPLKTRETFYFLQNESEFYTGLT